MLRRRDQSAEIISDHALKNDFDPKLIDLFGEKKGVSIHAERREQFRAHRDDLGIHG
jgi:hypothetical protein